MEAPLFPLEPPRDIIMHAGVQFGFLIFFGAIFGLLALLALWHIVKRREPLLLFLLIGGCLATRLEPICNVLANAYHPEIGQITAFEAISRKMPWHIVFVYANYFAIFGLAFMHQRELGLTRQGFWKIFWITAALSCVLEIVLVYYSALYVYYGPQPFNVAGLPLWWYVVNPACLIGASAFTAMAVKGLRGWQRWPVAILLPASGVGFFMGSASPLIMVLNSGADNTELGGLVTIGFSLCLMAAMGRLMFPADEPAPVYATRPDQTWWATLLGIR